MYEAYQHLRIARRGAILVVTLDHPPTNAIDAGTHTELVNLMTDVNRDTATKVLVLTGAGTRAFSAGGDINVMRQQLDDPTQILNGMQEAPKIIYGMLRLEKPSIARINGHAVGLGASLALLCDLSYAVETAKISDPHVGIGYVAADGGALIWPQLIGFARAREYLFTGDPITGAEAARIGLITRAVAAEDLDATVYGMAERLAASPTKALNWTKISINMILRRQFEAVVEAQSGLEFMSHFTRDHREAVMAFLEKRKPNFTGE